jgi:hypothetical protein
VDVVVVALGVGDRDEALNEGVLPRLGRRGTPTAPEVQEHRLADGDRLLLLSDAILDRPLLGGGTLGLDGVRAAVAKAPLASAAARYARSRTPCAPPPNPTVSELDNDA